MRGPLGFREARTIGEGGLGGVKDRAGSGFGLGNAKPIFFLGFLVKGRVGLGAVAFLLLLTKPFGLIDLPFGGRRSGVLLRGAGTTVGDQTFDGYDHRHSLDLAGNAASGDFRAQAGEFPEAVQDSLAAQVEAGHRFLLYELLLHTGTVLEHVVADTGFGFDVDGGVGVEAYGFGSTLVGHGSREDQVGKGYFLIGDEVADFIFGHRWLRGLEIEEIGTRVSRAVSQVLRSGRDSRGLVFPGERSR